MNNGTPKKEDAVQNNYEKPLMSTANETPFFVNNGVLTSCRL